MKTFRVPGRASTEEERKRLLDRLLAVWMHSGDLRLSQLILSCFYGEDFFYVEDEPFVARLEAFVEGL